MNLFIKSVLVATLALGMFAALGHAEGSHPYDISVEAKGKMESPVAVIVELSVGDVTHQETMTADKASPAGLIIPILFLTPSPTYGLRYACKNSEFKEMVCTGHNTGEKIEITVKGKGGDQVDCEATCSAKL